MQRKDNDQKKFFFSEHRRKYRVGNTIRCESGNKIVTFLFHPKERKKDEELNIGQCVYTLEFSIT